MGVRLKLCVALWVGLLWGWSGGANGLRDRWLEPCARQGFEAIFDHKRYTVKAPKSKSLPTLMAQGELDWDDGQLRIFMRYKLRQEDGSRHALLRGAEQFRDIVEHFGERATGIAARWDVGSGLTDNIDEFNRLTSAPHNLSEEEAARQTWTGRQALQNGFTEVHVKEVRTHSGRYTSVRVNFDRPQSSAQPQNLRAAMRVDVEMNPRLYRVVYRGRPDEGGWVDRIAFDARRVGDRLMIYVDKGSPGKSWPDVNQDEEVKKILDYFKNTYREYEVTVTQH